ncbi:MAG TPA: RHS repeat-associated core domain-containing protein [Allosphingosinicella sp.]
MAQTASTYAYDPLMRLAVIDSTNSALDVQFGYDGQEMAYEGLSGGRTRRYVYGPGIDEPLVAYLITSTGTSRLWYHGDERGSIVSLSDDAGTPGGIGKFDEYGVGGISRFRYTGQYWLGESHLLYYRARIYDPRLGRFLQPDPIGYGSGMNLYAYVGGDPVNFTDPSGLKKRNKPDIPPKRDGSGGGGGTITVTGNPADQALRDTLIMLNRIATHEFIHRSGMGSNGESPNDDIDGDGQPDPDIVVDGQKPSSPSGLILAGGEFDSGLPRDRAQLEKMLKEAKRAGDTKLTRRILRQQKVLAIRNSNKQRGLGRFRIIDPLIIIVPILQQQMHEFNCRMGVDDGIPCIV